jgi:hypothetical protein
MSQTAAREFISRVDGDEKFAGEFETLKGDPKAVLVRVLAEGFEVDSAEIRTAFLERYGDWLSPEQLGVDSAGMDVKLQLGLSIGGFLGGIALGAGAVGATL